MTKVVGVRFRRAGKIYYFDPGKAKMAAGSHVIVETARGIEYGTVLIAPKEVDDKAVVQPLKPVIRVATPEDDKTEQNQPDRIYSIILFHRFQFRLKSWSRLSLQSGAAQFWYGILLPDPLPIHGNQFVRLR